MAKLFAKDNYTKTASVLRVAPEGSVSVSSEF